MKKFEKKIKLKEEEKNLRVEDNQTYKILEVCSLKRDRKK
jgi:hypothetical protein